MVLQQLLSFFRRLCGETQLKSSWAPKLAVHGRSSLSTLPPSSQEIFSLKRRSLDFSSSQSHFSTCVLILFFKLLGREVGCKITRVAPGAHFREDGTFAIFRSCGGKAGLTYKLKSMIISNFLSELFRPPGEVPFGVRSSDFILTIS